MTYDEYLLHFGVKGMKWGVRKDRKVSVNVANAKAIVEARKKDLKSVDRRDEKAVKSATRELRYAKEDLSSVRILEKLNSKPKSKQQLEMEERYKQKGLNDDEAAVAAYKNIRTKKLITAAAATTLTLASAYAGYKTSNEFMDKTIKAGSSLQHISADGTVGVRDAFYSSKNKLDKIKYKGIFGSFLDLEKGGAYSKNIKVLSDIKQVSPNNAKKILQDLIKNEPEFAKGLTKYMDPDNVYSKLGPDLSRKAKRSIDKLKKGIVDKNIYEVFNVALVDHSPEMQSLTDKFFKKLSSKGYNAIKDVNDIKYSGYNALNPIITFNSKGKVDVVDVKKLAAEEINKNALVGYGAAIGSELVKKGAIAVAALTANDALTNHVRRKKMDKAVYEYRQKHPNTDLTNTQIARMIERSGE